MLEYNAHYTENHIQGSATRQQCRQSVVQITPTMQRHASEGIKIVYLETLVIVSWIV